jgi:hypothetical protein
VLVWITRRGLPAIRLTSPPLRFRFREDELDAWLDEHATPDAANREASTTRDRARRTGPYATVESTSSTTRCSTRRQPRSTGGQRFNAEACARSQVAAQALRRAHDHASQLHERETADVDGAAMREQQHTQGLPALARPRQRQRPADSAERAALTASSGSSLPRNRRSARALLPTSTTVSPQPLRWRVKPAP